VTWSDQFNTYEEACHYYGIDTPEQAADEGDWRDAEAICEEAFGPWVYDLRGPGLDPIEATYHVVREARLARKAAPRPFVDPAASIDDEIPF
jgi:hypothetical protein